MSTLNLDKPCPCKPWRQTQGVNVCAIASTLKAGSPRPKMCQNQTQCCPTQQAAAQASKDCAGTENWHTVPWSQLWLLLLPKTPSLDAWPWQPATSCRKGKQAAATATGASRSTPCHFRCRFRWPTQPSASAAPWARTQAGSQRTPCAAPGRLVRRAGS